MARLVLSLVAAFFFGVSGAAEIDQWFPIIKAAGIKAE